MSESVEYEAEVKIRRKGRIVKWEKGLGDTPLDALETATNDLIRELQSEASEFFDITRSTW